MKTISSHGFPIILADLTGRKCKANADPHSSLGSLGQPVGIKSKNSCKRHEVIEFPPVQLLYPPNYACSKAVVTAAAPRASGRPLPARRGKRSPSAGKG